MSDLQQQFRPQLEALRQDLEARLDRVERNVRHESEPLDKDFAEQAVQRENEEVVDALGNEARRQLTMVRAALRRMETGTYGQCESCGEPIAPARLQAIPHTPWCTACAERAEIRN